MDPFSEALQEVENNGKEMFYKMLKKKTKI